MIVLVSGMDPPVYLASLTLADPCLNQHSLCPALSFGENYPLYTSQIMKIKVDKSKSQIDIGIRRVTYDSITLNDGYGLDGFNSTQVSGTRRLLFKVQTQSYAPWSLIGFHFGPYLICSLGMVGDVHKGFKNSKVYSQFGLGVLIRNENLVFNTFQISVSFYPTIPGIGHNLYKMNSFRTTDFGFRDFEIGKPAPVIYR
jgi:hypothetical protein